MSKWASIIAILVMCIGISCSPTSYALFVERMIGEGPNADIKHSSLLMAAAKGDCETIKKLLSSGVKPDSARTKRGRQTALCVAFEFGQYSVASLLLENGANPNDPIGALSPLDECAWNADLVGYNMVKPYANISDQRLKDELLLHACSSVNSYYSPENRNPHSERLAIAEDLLRLGSNPNYRSPRDGVSPIIMAADHDHFEIVILLYSHGADPRYESSGHLSAVSILARSLSDTEKNISRVTEELDKWEATKDHIGTKESKRDFLKEERSYCDKCRDTLETITTNASSPNRTDMTPNS